MERNGQTLGYFASLRKKYFEWERTNRRIIKTTTNKHEALKLPKSPHALETFAFFSL
jgi:hypothetical protein